MVLLEPGLLDFSLFVVDDRDMMPSVSQRFRVAVVPSGFLYIIAMAGFLMIDVHAPAAAQSALTEDEFERILRDVAIDVASELPLVWPPGKFPLRVAFASGDDLKELPSPAGRQR